MVINAERGRAGLTPYQQFQGPKRSILRCLLATPTTSDQFGSRGRVVQTVVRPPNTAQIPADTQPELRTTTRILRTRSVAKSS